jgi:hypothetical protein
MINYSKELKSLSSEYEGRLHVPAEFEEMSSDELINQGIVSSRTVFENEHTVGLFRQIPRPLEWPDSAPDFHGNRNRDPEPKEIYGGDNSADAIKFIRNNYPRQLKFKF